MRPSGPSDATRAHCRVECHHDVIKLFSCTPGNPKESASMNCLLRVRGLVFDIMFVFAMIHGLCVAIALKNLSSQFYRVLMLRGVVL